VCFVSALSAKNGINLGAEQLKLGIILAQPRLMATDNRDERRAQTTNKRRL